MYHSLLIISSNRRYNFLWLEKISNLVFLYFVVVFFLLVKFSLWFWRCCGMFLVAGFSDEGRVVCWEKL